MEYLKLGINDKQYIKDCDKLLYKFLKEDSKYDKNYVLPNTLKSFSIDIESSDNILLAAIHDSRVIGFLFTYISKSNRELNPVAHISFIFVDKDYRMSGIGSNLINKLLLEIKDKDINIVEVKSFNDNIAANNLYKKFGFIPSWTNYIKL